jgi:hypothetical protein
MRRVLCSGSTLVVSFPSGSADRVGLRLLEEMLAAPSLYCDHVRFYCSCSSARRSQTEEGTLVLDANEVRTDPSSNTRALMAV